VETDGCVKDLPGHVTARLTRIEIVMNDPVFHEAYPRVRRRHGDLEWQTMRHPQVAEKIYREVRALDAERNPTPRPKAPKPEQNE
jgi:hypothetical protein